VYPQPNSGRALHGIEGPSTTFEVEGSQGLSTRRAFGSLVRCNPPTDSHMLEGGSLQRRLCVERLRTTSVVARYTHLDGCEIGLKVLSFAPNYYYYFFLR
jgi:hypothetical protein